MTFAELKTAYNGLSRDQKKEIAEEAGFFDDATIEEKVKAQLAPKEEQLKLVLSERDELKGKVEALEKEKLEGEMHTVIEAALSEGKILPANKEQWEKLFATDPEGVKGILKVKAKEIDTDKKGSGEPKGKGADEDNGALEMSDEEKRIHKIFGHSEEDIKQFSKDDATDLAMIVARNEKRRRDQLLGTVGGSK